MVSRKIRPLAAVILGSLLLAAAVGCTQPTDGGRTTGGEEVSENAGEETSSAEENGEIAETTGEAAGKNEAAGEMGSVPYADNDTVVLGTYDAYEPKEEAVGHGGEAMEEDELQQERIAGGAVGEVVSQNLEPLTGIVDYSEGDYVPVYGASEK